MAAPARTGRVAQPPVRSVTEQAPPYRAAALAGAAVFFLYVLTLAPTTAWWDASEYIATAHTLGIPHPPGNPLFVALARVWSLLLSPLGLPVAVRINLFSAATSAASAAFLFLIAHRVASKFVPQRWMALAGAGASALLSGTVFTVWSQSNVNEKVYTLSVLIGAAVSWLALLWYERRERPESLRYVLIALYLMVLGSTNHLMSVLPAPAFACFALAAGPTFLLRRTFWVRALPLALLGLSFNFFLPVRSAQDPVINEGEPTCAGFVEAAAAVYTNGGAGCAALAANLRRDQYAKPPVTQRMAPFGAQLLNYFQYFDWQWSRGVDPSPVPGNARLPFTLLFLLLGLLGLYAIARADSGWFVYFATFAATLTIGLVFYLNFKFGYSLAPTITDLLLHEVRERDYFFIGSFALWGMLAGIGLTRAWTALARTVSSPGRRVATTAVLSVALVPLVLNWTWADRAGDWASRDWAYDLLMSVEPYGVLFTNGDNDTFPLWYVQEVEEIRRDVTVIVGQYLHTQWYPKQLQRLTAPGRQRPFVAPDGIELYQDPGLPQAPILAAPPDVLDRVAGGRLPDELSVALPTFVAAYPAGTLLDRSHRIALAIIRDSAGARPIYFATAGGMMSQLGLRPWGVRHGLATKLVLRDDEELDSLGYVDGLPELGGERFDVARSVELYRNVYTFRGLGLREVWPDRSTDMIPGQFYVLALQLADVLERSGGAPEFIRRLELDAAAFQITAEGGTVLLPGD